MRDITELDMHVLHELKERLGHGYEGMTSAEFYRAYRRECERQATRPRERKSAVRCVGCLYELRSRPETVFTAPIVERGEARSTGDPALDAVLEGFEHLEGVPTMRVYEAYIRECGRRKAAPLTKSKMAGLVCETRWCRCVTSGVLRPLTAGMA